MPPVWGITMLLSRRSITLPAWLLTKRSASSVPAMDQSRAAAPTLIERIEVVGRLIDLVNMDLVDELKEEPFSGPR